MGVIGEYHICCCFSKMTQSILSLIEVMNIFKKTINNVAFTIKTFLNQDRKRGVLWLAHLNYVIIVESLKTPV